MRGQREASVNVIVWRFNEFCICKKSEVQKELAQVDVDENCEIYSEHYSIISFVQEVK